MWANANINAKRGQTELLTLGEDQFPPRRVVYTGEAETLCHLVRLQGNKSASYLSSGAEW